MKKVVVFILCFLSFSSTFALGWGNDDYILQNKNTKQYYHIGVRLYRGDGTRGENAILKYLGNKGKLDDYEVIYHNYCDRSDCKTEGVFPAGIKDASDMNNLPKFNEFSLSLSDSEKVFGGSILGSIFMLILSIIALCIFGTGAVRILKISRKPEYPGVAIGIIIAVAILLLSYGSQKAGNAFWMGPAYMFGFFAYPCVISSTLIGFSIINRIYTITSTLLKSIILILLIPFFIIIAGVIIFFAIDNVFMLLAGAILFVALGIVFPAVSFFWGAWYYGKKIYIYTKKSMVTKT